MRLNADCIRALLLYLEENISLNPIQKTIPISYETICASIEMKNFSPDDIAYTIKKLGEAGFLETKTTWNQHTTNAVSVVDISYAGHQFLENIRTPSNWKKTKEVCGKAGSFALEIIKSVSENLILATINQHL